MSISISSSVPSFSIVYNFYDESRETEISMLVNGENILSFERDGQGMTTRWNLDELALWLRDFLDHMKEDPYPVETEGEYAAIKDINAREFDTEDDEEFDAYYDKLDDWNLRHRWHPASSGAILSDLYFQLVDDNVEISWDNQDPEEGVVFRFKLGGVRIPKEKFVSEVNSFLRDYADHWF
ncbi:MAG: hypothetical protein IJL09_07770 [Lachnospiraceae bacterium]|nr:hypothetical protein [Lachnospiraceae bacterium]